MGILLYHYTDKAGWKAIRSQIDWTFRAAQPPAPHRPFGAYFTDIRPTPKTLRTLSKRLRIPKCKTEFVFQFARADGLRQHHGGRDREMPICYSPTDYRVEVKRQKFEGPTDRLLEN